MDNFWIVPLFSGRYTTAQWLSFHPSQANLKLLYDNSFEHYIKECNIWDLIAVLFKFQVVWDVTSNWLVNITNVLKALWTCESSVTIYQLTCCNIAGDLNFQDEGNLMTIWLNKEWTKWTPDERKSWIVKN